MSRSHNRPAPTAGSSTSFFWRSRRVIGRRYLALAILPGALFLLSTLANAHRETKVTAWAPVQAQVGAAGVSPPAVTRAKSPPTPGQTLRAPALSPRPARIPSGAINGWETIFSDDLEGEFPGDWHVFDNNGPTDGEYFWAQKACRPATGSYSAWVVGGGADGSSLNCGADYPDNTASWLVYGPFSLAEASDAEFAFQYWLNSEPDYDFLFVGASLNGVNFSGEAVSGSYDWSERIFDLTDVYQLGDLTGQPAVWVAIAFQSDSSITYAEGAYVDDLALRQFVADDPTFTPTPSNTPTPTSTPTVGPSPTPSSTPTSTPIPPGGALHLPVMMRTFPFVPDPPILNAIANSDGDGNYTISWGSAEGADTYTLQEDDNAGFSSPMTAYTGSATTKTIVGKDVGTYYYRVKAANAYAESGWSNVRSVTVTVSAPDCPWVGDWEGTTSQGFPIDFTVVDSPVCQIAAGSLSLIIQDSCFNQPWTVWMIPIAITDGHFDTGGGTVRVTGDFTSATTASGTFEKNSLNPFPPPLYCTASGVWTASR